MCGELSHQDGCGGSCADAWEALRDERSYLALVPQAPGQVSAQEIFAELVCSKASSLSGIHNLAC